MRLALAANMAACLHHFAGKWPFGGYWRAGLVVENMWLAQTRYPVPDSVLSKSQAPGSVPVDTCQSVAEVISNSGQIRLEQPAFPARIHYLITDAHGTCRHHRISHGCELAAIPSRTCPIVALAIIRMRNPHTLAHAQPASVGKADKPASTELPLTRSPCRALSAASNPYKQGRLGHAFDTLEQVCQGNNTVWPHRHDVSSPPDSFFAPKQSRNRASST